MKKYFTLMFLAIFGGLVMMSCDRTDTVVPVEDNDTYPIMKDTTL